MSNTTPELLASFDASVREYLCPFMKSQVACTPVVPLAVFADEGARRYLTGSAWHLYGGDISAS